MQRPTLAAVANLSRLASPCARPQFANAVVQGHRYASVKAQGAYKKKSKRGIPKKLGAKRTGGMNEATAKNTQLSPCHKAKLLTRETQQQINMSSPATSSTNSAARFGGLARTA
jgi:hypothetical protein